MGRAQKLASPNYVPAPTDHRPRDDLRGVVGVSGAVRGATGYGLQGGLLDRQF